MLAGSVVKGGEDDDDDDDEEDNDAGRRTVFNDGTETGKGVVVDNRGSVADGFIFRGRCLAFDIFSLVT